MIPATPEAEPRKTLFCAQCYFGEGLRVVMSDGKCPRCVIEGDQRRLRTSEEQKP